MTPPPEPAGRPPAQAVLVVDLGTTTSSSILLAGGERRLVKDPSTGRDWWPTSVFDDGGRLVVGSAAEDRKSDNPRAYLTEFKPRLGSDSPVLLDGRSYPVVELAAAVLRELRSAARQLGFDPDRLLITVPVSADEKQRAATLDAGRLAGFIDVEALEEPIAAAHSQTVGSHWADGDVVLVYDLGGGTFDAALVRMADAEQPKVLAQGGLAENHGAREVDAALVQDFRPRAKAWLAGHQGRADERDLLDQAMAQAAVTLKHRLTAAESARAYVSLGLPPMAADRDRLRQITEPLLRGTVDCCLTLLDEAHLTLDDITGILLVGGGSRMPVVAPYLANRMGRPLHPAADAVLAVVEGAARWAAGMAARRTPSDVPPDLVRPLRWTLPRGDRAVLGRWLVEPGDAYSAGSTLARVRLVDGALHDLSAREPGRVVQRHLSEDQEFFTGDWILTSLRPPTPAEVRGSPRMVRSWAARVTALACSPNGRRLAVAEQESPDRCTVRVVDAHSTREICRRPERGRVRALAWTRDSAHLAFGLSSREQSVQLLDPENPAIAAWTSRLPGAAQALEFLPGGQYLAIACGQGSLRLIDAGTGRTHTATEIPAWAATLSVHPDGRTLAVGGDDGESGSGVTHVIDLDDEQRSRTLTHTAPVRAVRFSPDGRSLAVAGGEAGGRGYLHVYDTSAWSVILASTHRPSMRAVALSPDGALVAAAGSDASVRVWSVHDRGLRAQATTAGDPTAVALTSDGHRLVVGAQEGVHVWALTHEGEA
ncbi:Hsp70 family protein [Streptomyces mirabilis]|uniref:Hsp70 family protein n=1 Tax=Streptomyces mirabilis TaxID=68239 RepID=UPI0021C147FD|nr:Hsp70 family protein [Streptomyces mirabilis]MCT9113645.1 Hsp70 family protein [Streptomyces mirabilis]